MALDKISSRTDVPLSAIVLAIWALWLGVMSVLPLPAWIVLPMSSLVLIYGALLWDMIVGAFMILIMVWIHHTYSVAPTGLLWIVYFSTFGFLKFLMTQFNLRGPSQFFFTLVGASFAIDFAQLVLMNRSFDNSYFTFALFGSIVVSAVFQGTLGLVFVKPILARSRVE